MSNGLLKTRNIIITGTGSYVPSRVVTNKELEKLANTTDEWTYKNVGVKERRCVDGEVASDLASAAGLKAIEAAGIDKEDVDLIILATTTPDRQAPSTACLTKHKMGIVNQSPAFDVVAVCAGFAYAMNMAASMISGGQFKKVLVIGCDAFSTITDWSRRDCVFFGDGAGAIIMEPSSLEDTSKFVSKICANTIKTDGFTVYPGDETFTMIGRDVYEAATKALPEVILAVVDGIGKTVDDIDHIIPHQPAIRVLQKTAEVLNIPFDTVHTNMDRYANTAGATIPLLLDEVVKKDVLKDGDLIVMAGIGAGWAWGACAFHCRMKT